MPKNKLMIDANAIKGPKGIVSLGFFKLNMIHMRPPILPNINARSRDRAVNFKPKNMPIIAKSLISPPPIPPREITAKSRREPPPRRKPNKQ